MNLREQVLAYIQAPYPVYNGQLATALAQAGWGQLVKETGLTPGYYSVAGCLTGYQAAILQPLRLRLPTQGAVPAIEVPAFDQLRDFYAEHGLEPLTERELAATYAPAKLRQALELLATVAPAYACVSQLVHTMQVLQSPEAEIDVSYSHPAVPFSVFVSVCEDTAFISSLRVAESLLHETMHLKLTLLEQVVELVLPDSTGVYYSPWRDEDRPVRGVLHGLFVFRAVRDFYLAFNNVAECSQDVRDFLENRIESIGFEFEYLRNFTNSLDLSANGRQLALSLLGNYANVDKRLLPMKILPPVLGNVEETQQNPASTPL